MLPILLLDIPSAPTNLICLKSTVNSITVSWNKPSDRGNPPTNSYLVEAVKDGSKRRSYTELDTTNKYQHTFQSLDAKTWYTVRIIAYNAAGRGAEVIKKQQTVPYTRPGW